MKFLAAVVSILMFNTAVAVTKEQHIAAIEGEITPMLVIKGENTPVLSLSERMQQLEVLGLSVALLKEGKIEWAKAYGYADRERGTRVTTETLFEAGSISKAVSAVAALQLVERGALDLDANVNDRLRSWHLPENEFTRDHKVSVRNILNHTAGLTASGFPGYARSDTLPSVIDVLEGKGKTEAVRVWTNPGASWHYSGGGYTVMQVLLTDVTGQSFPELMRDRVLKPLAMDRSTYQQPLPERLRGRAASGYNHEGVKVAGDWHVYPEMAAAGLWTTPTDLVRFALALQSIYQGSPGVLSSKMAHSMFTPGQHGDGLGVFITTDGQRFGHDGANAGFQATLTAFIGSKTALAIMTNSDNGGRLAQELALTIARQYGWSGFPQTEKTVIHLTNADSARLVGHYKLDAGGAGEFDLTSQNGHIILSSTEIPQRELMAESPEKFFLREDGTPLELLTENGSTALNIGGTLHAVKIR